MLDELFQFSHTHASKIQHLGPGAEYEPRITGLLSLPRTKVHPCWAWSGEHVFLFPLTPLLEICSLTGAPPSNSY